MSKINDIISVFFEMQSLETMMQSYQQAIVTDPVKLANLQMKNQNFINMLTQQDPEQGFDPQQDPNQNFDPQNNQDPNQNFDTQNNQDPNQG